MKDQNKKKPQLIKKLKQKNLSNHKNNFQKFKMFGNDYAQMRDASAGGSANNTYMDCYKESSGTSTQAASWDNNSIHSSNAQKKLFLAFVYNTT